MGLPMEGDELRRAIQRLAWISSPSESLDRILELSADCESQLDELAVAIESDPAVTSRVLRLSNSAYFGMVGGVETVSRAIIVVGYKNVLGLATCAALAPMFAEEDPRVDRSALWLHSCATAEASRIVASQAGFDPSVAHVAGLLHDLGVVVLSEVLGSGYDKVIAACRDGSPLFEAERACLGVDHGWAAGVLFERWTLPRSLMAAVALHHAPAGDESGLASLVALADHLASKVGFRGVSRSTPGSSPDPFWLETLGLKPEQLDELTEALHERCDAIEFSVRAGVAA